MVMRQTDLRSWLFASMLIVHLATKLAALHSSILIVHLATKLAAVHSSTLIVHLATKLVALDPSSIASSLTVDLASWLAVSLSVHGPGLICELDGQTYCEQCHLSQFAYIPAEIIFNWNFKKRKGEVTFFFLSVFFFFLSALCFDCTGIPDTGPDERSPLFFSSSFFSFCFLSFSDPTSSLCIDTKWALSHGSWKITFAWLLWLSWKKGYCVFCSFLSKSGISPVRPCAWVCADGAMNVDLFFSPSSAASEEFNCWCPCTPGCMWLYVSCINTKEV